MNKYSQPSEESLRQTVETFWEALPPFWHHVRAHIHRLAVEEFNISVEQFHILRHIRRGCRSVSELAQAKNISRPATSQAVEVLVQKGLISRTTDVQDRRHMLLALTDSGNTLLDAIFTNIREWMMQDLSTLSEQELQDLTRGLQVLKKIQTI